MIQDWLLGANTLSNRLYESGILVNAFGGLPGVPRPALRIGLNEATRYGLKENDVAILAEAFVDVIRGTQSRTVAKRVKRLREQFRETHYCFESFGEIVTNVKSYMQGACVL